MMTDIFPIRKLMKWIFLGLLLMGLLFEARRFAENIPFDDFLAYWSAARLQLTGQNPYSLEQLQSLQIAVGFKAEVPYMMWYPPWAFPLILPFGCLDYVTGRAVWLLAHLFLLVFCASILWRLYGGSQKDVLFAWVLALTFAPSTFVLRNGQMALVLLTGMVGFLYFERARNDWAAGISLYLLAVKPHLAFLFWIALGLWILERKRWTILISATLSIVVASVLPLFFNPFLITQSLNVTTKLPPFDWVTPTLGTFLRLAFGPERVFLQWLPTIVMSISLVFYWRKKKEDWSWFVQLPLLVALGLVTSVYSWASDLVLLLPLLLKISLNLSYHLRIEQILYLTVYVILNCVAFGMNVFGVNGAYYAWVSPAFLFGYQEIQKQTLVAETISRKGQRCKAR
jgi:hypothetical protein